MVLLTGEQPSAYGTVAEHDPTACSPEMEPLSRHDDGRQRAPVGVHDLGPEDLHRVGTGHEVPPSEGTRELTPPVSRNACSPEQVVVQVAHGEEVHMTGVERTAGRDPPDSRLRTGDGVGNGQLVRRNQVAPATQPATQTVKGSPTHLWVTLAKTRPPTRR